MLERDAESISCAAADTGADLVVTTEKDATRLSVPNLFYLPMRVSIEPADRFLDWLAERLRAARARRGIAA